MYTWLKEMEAQNDNAGDADSQIVTHQVDAGWVTRRLALLDGIGDLRNNVRNKLRTHVRRMINTASSVVEFGAAIPEPLHQATTDGPNARRPAPDPLIHVLASSTAVHRLIPAPALVQHRPCHCQDQAFQPRAPDKLEKAVHHVATRVVRSHLAKRWCSAYALQQNR
ncbi:hypothetical protein BC940DRAFT_318519 [Gongronella butleri]|nr:hypothetical protein BC940DRAFT_318519 [Gongronella butleri]